MARKFDSFERQVEIGRLKKEIKKQKFEEEQEKELKGLKQEVFKRTPTGKIKSKFITGAKRLGASTITGAKRLGASTLKFLNDPPEFLKEPQRKKSKSPKSKESKPFSGELIDSPFPKQKRKRGDFF